jgi:tRNA threonylcarbamoyl adenosine modification protein (Sua5/YciO/YrdC/YwlC family)
VTSVDTHDTEQMQQLAQRAAEVFASGGLVIFPTETVYGIGASVAHDAGYRALRHVKGRPEVQPFTLHTPTPDSALRYVDPANKTLTRLIRKVFPGPVTLVVDVDDATIDRSLAALGLPADHRDRLYHDNTIGLRCPDHPLAEAVLGAVPDPIVASSANLRGDAPPLTFEQAVKALGDKAQLVVDGGPCRFARPSTIVRVHTNGQVEVQREGVYDERYIRKLLRWNLLLVCSGNTCRSPMAEAMAKQIVAGMRQISPDQLDEAGVRITSAGSFATSGASASDQAVEVMQRRGLDVTRHRSRSLSLELVNEADVILCMTRSHRRAVLDMAPHAGDKTLLLDPDGDIDDPYGSDVAVYEACADQIRTHLEARLQELLP